MTSIHTDLALLKYFKPDGIGKLPAYNLADLTNHERRQLVEALIDYYVSHEAERERAG